MNKDIFVAAFEKKLYHYSHKEETLQNISERLEYIESELTNVGSSNLTSYSSRSSDYNVVENKRLNLLSEQIALSQQLKKVEYEYLEIKKGLSYLSKEELELIDLKYFKKWDVEKIEKHKFISRSVIYDKLNKALLKMTERLVGNRR